MRKIIITTIIMAIIAITVLTIRSKPTIATDDMFHYPGKKPYKMLFSPDYTVLYAAGPDGIEVIDKETMIITDTLEFEHYIYDMAIGPDGDYIYCVYNPGDTNQGKLSRINTETGQIATIDLTPANVYKVVIDDVGEYLYVSGGTWPEFGEPVGLGEHSFHIGTGRIFEIRLSDFTLTRSANLSVALRSGLSYQDGKLVVMSPQLMSREMQAYEEGTIVGTTCHIIDVDNLTIEETIGVPFGDENTSYALSGDTYVMAGFNSDTDDGVGMGLINAQTGEVEQWYITDPIVFPDGTPEGGGEDMAEDSVNHILYALIYTRKTEGKTHFRVAVIDLTTNAYSEWLLAPCRLYSDILYDPEDEKIYLSVPFEDAIAVLDPPE